MESRAGLRLGTWVQWNPCADLLQKEKATFRQTHRKSRNGCVGCKQRHIKCDEQRPSCSQCLARFSLCAYATRPASGRNKRKSFVVKENVKSNDAIKLQPGVSDRVSHQSSNAILADALGLTSVIQKPKSKSLLDLLQQFSACCIVTLSSPTGQFILHSRMPALFLDHAYLLHSAIALAAAYAQAKQGLLGRSDGPATYHGWRAMALYSNRLEKRSIHPDEADAMLATSLILVALFFVQLGHSGKLESWIFTANGDQPGWVQILSGVGLVVQAYSTFGTFVGHRWQPFLLEARTQYERQPRTLSNLPEFLQNACMTDCSDKFLETDTVKRAISNVLKILETVVSTKFWDRNLSEYQRTIPASEFPGLVSVPSRLSSDFVQMVRVKEPRALLLIGFWFALMCKIEHCQWWCLPRSSFEGWLIVSYLVRSYGSIPTFERAASELGLLLPAKQNVEGMSEKPYL